MASSPIAKASPWRIRILELLANGDWWEYGLLIREVSPMVPAGMAWRQAETSRARHYIDRGLAVPERTRGSKSDTIITGQRFYIGKAINQLKREGKIEVEYTNNPKRQRPLRIRLINPQQQAKVITAPELRKIQGSRISGKRGRRPSPWREEIARILDDGEWHDYSDVVFAVLPMVPADMARQKAEERRIGHYMRMNPNAAIKPRQYGDPVLTGRRTIVIGTIQDMKTSHIVTVQPPEDSPTGRRRIRKKNPY